VCLRSPTARGAARRAGRLFQPAAHGVHEIETVDAEVILGLCLDVHLLEPRHRAIARRPEDAHRRRLIFQHANEILRLTGTAEPFAVGERNAIRTVLENLERTRERAAVERRQGDGLTVAERQLARRRVTVVWMRTRTSVPAGA